MANVSAIPENLYRYSDVCTNGAEQLQTWVRSVLAPTLTAYQNGGGCISAIDVDVARQVAAAYYTDRDVRTVGLAFLRAGGVLVRGRNQPIFSNNKAIASAFEKLQAEAASQQAEAAHQAQIKAGAALANRLMHAKPVEVTGIVRELAKHGNDPYFSAGFYNNLDERHIETAMAQGGIPALVSAYASGVLDKKVYEAVNHRLTRPIQDVRFAVSLEDHYMTAAQKLQFLNGIGANPVAARNFADSLNPGQLRKLFYGPPSEIPGLRGSLINSLTVAMGQQPGQTQAQALLHKISVGFFGDGAPKMTRSEWEPLTDPLKQLYVIGVQYSIESPPPPGSYPDAMDGWGDRAGQQVGADIAPFLHAADDAAPNHELLKSMIQGGYANVWFMFTAAIEPPAGVAEVAYTAAVGALQSVYSAHDPIKGLLDWGIPDGDAPDATQLNQQISLAGFTVALGKMIEGKQIYDNRTGKLVEFGKDRVANQEILRKILKDQHSYTAGEDHGKDHAPTIFDLAKNYGSSEKDPALDALKSGYEPPKD
ncbi:hypothetical protein ACWGMA_11595 [Streptomyces asiaticus]